MRVISLKAVRVTASKSAAFSASATTNPMPLDHKPYAIPNYVKQKSGTEPLSAEPPRSNSEESSMVTLMVIVAWQDQKLKLLRISAVKQMSQALPYHRQLRVLKLEIATLPRMDLGISQICWSSDLQGRHGLTSTLVPQRASIRIAPSLPTSAIRMISILQNGA